MITKAFKNKRSEYTFGCPRPDLGGCGIGMRSTSRTNVISSDSCGIIEVASVYGWMRNLYNTAVASLSASLGVAFYL